MSVMSCPRRLSAPASALSRMHDPQYMPPDPAARMLMFKAACSGALLPGKAVDCPGPGIQPDCRPPGAVLACGEASGEAAAAPLRGRHEGPAAPFAAPFPAGCGSRAVTFSRTCSKPIEALTQ